MSSLSRVFGLPMASIIIGLSAVWILGLIIAPQVIMVEKSLWHMEKGSDDAALSVKIDTLYNQIDLLALDQADLGNLSEDIAKKAEMDQTIVEIQTEIAELENKEVAAKKVYSLRNYMQMGQTHLFIFFKTIAASVAVTLIAFVVCYPIAYAMAKLSSPGKAALIMMGLIIPYAINELLRVFAWLMILNNNGVINYLLGLFGIEPIPFLNSGSGVFIAMVYAFVLFMVFPIYNTVETLDTNQLEAARDLGAPMWKIHWRIVLPHAKPGIAVGSIMTFMLSAGSYAVPYIMTRGTAEPWFTQLIYNKFFESSQWNAGAAYAFTLLVASILFIMLLMRIFRVGLKEIAR